jgi:hypothetical protein
LVLKRQDRCKWFGNGQRIFYKNKVYGDKIMNESYEPTDANFKIGSFQALEMKQWNKFGGYVTQVINGTITEIDCQPPEKISIVKGKGNTISVSRSALYALCHHCYAKGSQSVFMMIDEAYRQGKIKTFEDLFKATETLHSLWNEERSKSFQLERQGIPQKKSRRGYVPTDAELNDAHKKSKSWIGMARNLSKNPDKKIGDKKVKGLWKEYCTRKGIAFKDKFSA